MKLLQLTLEERQALNTLLVALYECDELGELARIFNYNGDAILCAQDALDKVLRT